MAKGWMSKDPSEMTARQQRRMQYMEKRGRGGRVQGQPTEMPEMTARQQRRQQFLERKQARQDRQVADYRAQQAANQGQSNGFNLPQVNQDQLNQIFPNRFNLPQVNQDELNRMIIQGPPPSDYGTYLGQVSPGANFGDYANAISGGFGAERQPMQYQPAMDAMTNRIDPSMRQSMMQQQMTQNPMDANPFAQSRNQRATPYGPVGSAPFRMRR
jgi:hypothetical protein